jgi:hypothetical protein
MKTLLLLALITINQGFAANVDTQGDVLSAQVQVTHDSLQQVLAKMRNAPMQTSGDFSNPDFVAKAQAFNAKVEEAMIQFEKELKDPILKQAAFYVDRLNAIQNSQVYSAEQKKAVLADQIRITKITFKGLSEKYAEAIYKLYTTDLESPAVRINVNYCFDDDLILSWTSSDPKISDTSKARTNLRLESRERFDCRDLAWKKTPIRFYEVYSEQLKPFAYPQPISAGCYSSSCLALSSNHRIAYINLVQHDIDKPIKFFIAGQEIAIDPLNLQTVFIKRYLTIPEEQTSDLPFDISEANYQKVKEAEKDLVARASKTSELQKLLLGPTSGFFQNWECPAQVREIKTDLCHSVNGCLAEQEMSKMIQAINDSELYRKSNRIDCAKN